MSSFFAFLSRMRFIRRWGLMHNTYPENVQEHSLRVATIAHALAVIRNRLFDGRLVPERAALLALYHDASEVLTGDLPTPVKYFNPAIRSAYQEIEAAARDRLLSMVPAALREDFRPLLGTADPMDQEHWELVKAADRLCAYLKCVEETSAGNQEFKSAERTLAQRVAEIPLPEVRYFVDEFLPSFKLDLDQLE